ncbi:MAG: hypothetical protein WBA74_11930 [Cyclobacteriaceae bacterium]
MKNNKLIFVALILGYLAMLALITTVIAFIRDSDQFFFNLAASLLVSWILTVMIFYVWAVYYFHIHLAVDEEELSPLAGQTENIGKAVAFGNKLLKNPHLGETLGLPRGTIRGTMALSLLIAGLSLLIASLEMNQTFDANSLFIDNYEFIKTAFLMVIAFYFGHKSITAITSGSRGVYRPEESSDYYTSGSGNYLTENDSPVPNINDSADSPPIISNAKATDLKKALKAENHVETTDTGDTKDFEDKDAVG